MGREGEGDAEREGERERASWDMLKSGPEEARVGRIRQRRATESNV